MIRSKRIEGIPIGKDASLITKTPPLFSSACLIIDHEIKDGNGKAIAVVLYSGEGNSIIWLRPDLRPNYDPLEVMVAGETYVFETIKSPRFKQWEAFVLQKNKEQSTF